MKKSIYNETRIAAMLLEDSDNLVFGELAIALAYERLKVALVWSKGTSAAPSLGSFHLR
jgi:hypothetical protein